MYWAIYDDYLIRRIKPKTNKSLLIRVLEPCYLNNGIPYQITHEKDYLDVLNLYFDDIEYMPKSFNKNLVLFNEETAKKLIDFLKKYDFEEVNVHCEAGVSRSSAVMICISKLIQIPEIENNIYKLGIYKPNRLILDIFNRVIGDNYHCITNKVPIHSNEFIEKGGDSPLEIVQNENGSFSIEFL